MWQFIPKPLFNLSPDEINTVSSNTYQFFNSLSDKNYQVHMRIIIHNAPHTLAQYARSLTSKAGRYPRKHWGAIALRALASHIVSITDLYQPYVYLVFFGDSRRYSDFDTLAINFANATGMEMVKTPSSGARLPGIFSGAAVAYENYLFVPGKSVARRYSKKKTSMGRYWKFYFISDVTGTLNISNVARPLFSLQQEWMLAWDFTIPLRQVFPAKVEVTKLRALKSKTVGKPPDSKVHEQYQMLKQALDDFREGRDALIQTYGAFALSASTERELQESSISAESILSQNFVLADIPGSQGNGLITPITIFTKSPYLPGFPKEYTKRYLRASEIGYGNIIMNGAPRKGGERGMFLGRSLENNHPIVIDLFSNPKNANHAIILGATGAGKTVMLQTYAFRYLADGVRVIVLEPQGHFERLGKMVGPESGHINRMSFDYDWSINIMDRLYDDATVQANHVINQLALLLGKQFNDMERAVLSTSLSSLYQQFGQGTLTLSSLVDELSSRKWSDASSRSVTEAATNLAEYIRLTVVGNERLNHRYGRQTNGIILDPSDKDLLVFNFKGVPTSGENERFMTLMYYQILSNLEHHVKHSSNRRPTILIVDEYYYMSRNPVLADAMSKIFKTYRTFSVAAWLAGQNMSEFVEGRHKNYLVSNAPHFMLLKQGRAEVDALKHYLPIVDKDLLETLVHAAPGHGLFLFAEREPIMFRNELTEVEQQAFLGT